MSIISMAGYLRLNFMGKQLWNLRSRCSTFSRTVMHNDIDKKNHLSEIDDKKTFTSVFPHIVKSLAYEEDSRLSGMMNHLKQVLEYNVPHGKKNRGIATLVTFKMLNEHKSIDKEQLYLVNVMGWCIELLQAFFLIADDVMDQSHTRRGKPCWFRKVILKTSYGQGLDLLYSADKTSTRFDMFTPDIYATITEYKTSYYSFYLPVAAALYMSGITDPNTHVRAKEILIQIGHYFQVQDDFLDCFGNSTITGKMGTDIQEGKCTWLIVNALRKADTTQLQLLKDNYGRGDLECVQHIKQLYQDLEIPQMYVSYEQDMQSHLTTVVQKEILNLPVTIFEYCLKQIYMRKS